MVIDVNKFEKQPSSKHLAAIAFNHVFCQNFDDPNQQDKSEHGAAYADHLFSRQAQNLGRNPKNMVNSEAHKELMQLES